jgi:parvulin-like peptidyl-prolyl isomerase
MPRIVLSVIMVVFFAASSYAQEVVATVNGTSLTQKDLDAELDRLIPTITFHRSVSNEKRKFYYDQALQELINRELQYQDALARNMKPEKEKLDAQMERIRNKFKTPEEYKAASEKEGLSEENVRARIEKNMMIQTVFSDTVTAKVKVSDEEVKQYYEKNASRFKQPESVKLRLISAKDEKKARDILEMLKSGDDFGEIAYNMSEDSYRAQKGDIGYMHKGRMVPDIEEAAFKLKIGETSGVINAENTWFIIKLEDKKPEHQLPFEEVRDKLKKDLEKERTKELNDKWVADLRAKAKIEVLLKTEEQKSEKK